MPILIENTNVKPTIITEPDMRFATTFLATKYRDYSVPGEVLMDKVSGEIFIKREDDGKIVSFFQNKKFLHDLMLEVEILLANNPNLSYPTDSEDAFFVSSNYDLIAINEEKLINLVTDNVTIPSGKLVFKLSASSNGFFMRQATRDCDKPIVDLLTNQYTKVLYHDTWNGEILYPKMMNKNAIVHYSVEAVGTNGGTLVQSISYSAQEYIRMNESCPVLIPDEIISNIHAAISDIEYYQISIDSIEILIKDMLSKINLYDQPARDAFDNIIYDDMRVEVAELNIMHFVDKASDILKAKNQTLISFIDIPTLTDMIAKILKITSSQSSFIVSINEPPSSTWMSSTIWAERIRDVSEGGTVYETSSETKFADLQSYFAASNGRGTNITTNRNSSLNFFISERDLS